MHISRLTLLLICCISLFFAATASYFVWQGSRDTVIRFDWPDETANYFWIRRVAAAESLSVPEPLNVLVQNSIHPRSMNVRHDGALVPGSFLGLIGLYGLAAKIFGLALVPYLTPLLALLALLAWFDIVRRMFQNRRLAIITFALTAGHGAWFYYTAMSLLPNVAFISFFILSLWLLCVARTRWSAGVAGLLFGLAVIIRPAEIVWLSVLGGISLWIFRRHHRIPSGIAFVVGSVLPISWMFFIQWQLYGNPLVSGYANLDSQSACTWCNHIVTILAPFGLHPHLAWVHFWKYFIGLWPWYSIAFLVGFILSFMRTTVLARQIRWYACITAPIALYLVLYYGSWQFSDPLTTQLNTVGLSYVRYWLPVTIMCMPVIGYALVTLAEVFRRRYAYGIMAVVVLALVGQSMYRAIYVGDDGLRVVKERMYAYAQQAKRINAVTPDASIVITVRKDKVVFPDRRVIHSFEPLHADTQLQQVAMTLLQQGLPVYYYALRPEEAFATNVQLNPVIVFNPNEILYQLTLTR